MEVFDFEDDHLHAVLPEERTLDGSDVDPDEGIFISPTEYERRQQQLQRIEHDNYDCHDASNPRHFSTKGLMNNGSVGCSSSGLDSSGMSTTTAAATKASATISLPLRSMEMNTSSERYQHLPLYAQSSFVIKHQNEQDDSQIRLSIDRPPLNVPEGMYVPEDNRIHEILKRTAERVVTSPQLQIMLKVKQQNNPDFAFLHNKYVEYYEWYKNHYARQQQQQQQALILHKEDVKKNSQHNEGSMQSLLGVYSSSSSSCSSSNSSHTCDNEEKVDGDTRDVKRVLNEHDQRADRLKRAKMLRDHFQKKLEASSSSKPKDEAFLY